MDLTPTLLWQVVTTLAIAPTPEVSGGVQLATAPGLARMMDAIAADRAFNRPICR